jgi:hypothetical protein
VENWEQWAVRMLYKMHRDAATGNAEAVRLRDEVMSYPGVREVWKNVSAAPVPAMITMRLRKGNLAVSLFSTISTLGLPCDVTVQALKIECFFPADRASELVIRQLTSSEPALLHA